MKKHLTFLVSLLCIALTFTSCSIQSVDDYYSSSGSSGNGSYATVSIDCKTILDNYDMLDESIKNEKYVPNDGVILEETKYPIDENDTAFSILQKATKDKRIHLEFQGAEQNALGSVYVKGINHIYEFSCGELSGWYYSVNGEFGNTSSANYKLSDGDVVRWQYTCNLGADLGAPNFSEN
ncbi:MULTISPECIES: DUF4430 domain-containing protein [unclassified Ruminococcus]|uniref:DUF4430 domain-containing protein n=1 Tax=unclassified Ruminococcus TaxID=2608920 RepID=UPI002108D7A8|nr:MULTISPECIES: DUF4430 domain-containing protein [unclassified Ruminococcus]MCQ4022061.1 DUF4430 domain-containing protein [Ruminococcus sp. zg-924]MCQ4114381.1 DUF4430 domain-containing protein [Ruminococcus sp. zg-921]